MPDLTGGVLTGNFVDRFEGFDLLPGGLAYTESLKDESMHLLPLDVCPLVVEHTMPSVVVRK